MGDWEVRRWRRYGKDRLYVHDGNGVAVGWRDQLTGEDHVETRERLDELRSTVESWQASQGMEPTAAPPPPDAPQNEVTPPLVEAPRASVASAPTVDLEPSIPMAPPMWHDLAAHRAVRWPGSRPSP